MIPALEQCVAAFSRLPTIGSKSAWRLCLHLLERPQDEVDTLARSIQSLKHSVTTCTTCFHYSEQSHCPICSSPRRNHELICVVAKPTDVFSIEQSHRYNGVYHVLGGVLSPINGVTAEKLRIRELQQRIQTTTVKEIILGLGAGADAETTTLFLARLLSNTGIRLTRFARGLPAGLELEYVDQITLTQALNERTDITYSGDREAAS